MTADDARFLMENFQTDYVNQHYHYTLEKIEKKIHKAATHGKSEYTKCFLGNPNKVMVYNKIQETLEAQGFNARVRYDSGDNDLIQSCVILIRW